MSNYGWTNEAGEPIMSGEAYRFEQAIDEQYAYERAYDAYAEDYYVDPAEDDRYDDEDYGPNEDAAMEFGLFGNDC